MDVLLELAFVTMFGRLATATIENLNAQIRRLLSVSYASKTMTVETLNAKFIHARIRNRELNSMFPWGHRKRGAIIRHLLKRNGLASSRIKSSKRKRGGGGAWRAYVRYRCRQLKTKLFAGIGREYRNLSREEKAHFAQLGVAGTLAHRYGFSFGPDAKTMDRELAIAAGNRRAAVLAHK